MSAQTVQYATNVRYIHGDLDAVARKIENDPCTDLWNSVITLAIEDARRRNKEGRPTNEAQQAREWLFGQDSEADFRAVCELAHLDHTWVRAMADRFIALPQLPLARTLNGAA